MKNMITKPLRERMEEVVETSYRILCNKIAAGNIKLHNEASLQLQLGTILNQVGALYEFARNDHFAVYLEMPIALDSPTVKCKNGKARCDVCIELTDGAGNKAEAMIELKCFLKRYTSSETITMHRYAVLCDIENLEKYQSQNPDALCYEILYTDNGNYAKPNAQKFSLSDQGTICSFAGDNNDAPVALRGNYKIEWDNYEETHYFLNIKL